MNLRCFRWYLLLVLAFLAGVRVAPAQQLPAEEQATQLLDAARRAYNERNFPFAADRFKQFLQQYGNHAEAHSARLGWGVALLESPQPQYRAAIDPLRPAAESAEFSERGLANFYLGTAYRALGHAALLQASLKPNEAPQHINTANGEFEQALKAFEIAATAFKTRVMLPLAAEEDLPADYEWSTRSQLDAVEMQLRLGKTKEATASLEKLLAEKELVRSKYRQLAQYYRGYEQYSSGDSLAAAKTLSQLAPFENPTYGPHARYMLGRAHHQLGDTAEAGLHYEAILTAYDEELKQAKLVAGNGELFKNEPQERARLLLVAQSPPPDYVARSWFFAGVLLYEQEKFADALERFTQFADRYKLSPLLKEAVLRKGMAQVRLRMNTEALATLAPLQDDPLLSDQARWWLGRANVGLALENPAAAQNRLNNAVSHFKTGADRANQRAPQDPAAKLRRQDMLLEAGDAHQRNKQFNEAVGMFQQVLNEQPEAERGETALQRLATALNLAGKYAESDTACEKFAAAYPKSPLLPAVLFRHEENALAVAETAFKNPQLANREAALKTAYGEVAKRAEKLIAAYPEAAEIPYAYHALGLAQYRTGDFERAAATLQQVPAPDRSDDLATVSYLLADCLLRLAPETADDALAAGELLEQAGEVVKLLDGFIATVAPPNTPPTHPSLPDALVKLGDAHLRMALVIEDEQERNQTLQLARQSYEKVMQQFGQHPAAAIATYERARCMLAQNDRGGAMNEYRRFLGDPLRNSPVAPMAILRMATLLRMEKRPQDAVDPLNQTRQRHEAALLADPARAAWAPLLQYHQALCLKEANKLPEAQALFENLVQRFPKSLEGSDAAWRVQQCRREQLLARLEPARITLARPDAPAAEIATASAIVSAAMTEMAQIVGLLEKHAATLEAGSEPQLATLHEAAWGYRLLAQHEIALAREKLREAGRKERQNALNKSTPAGKTPLQAAAPAVPVADVPLQEAEVKARALYNAIIEQGGESRLVPIAKLQLAEVLVLREEFEPASSLLQDALGGEIADDLVAQLKVRLAACLLAQEDGDGAFDEVEELAKDEKNPVYAEARFLAGEALLVQEKFAEAVEQLKLFRDHGPLQNIAGVSDRALMRLGAAYERLEQFDPARSAYETLWGRFPQSPFRLEARYAQGVCLQRMNQHDAAVNTYNEVVRHTTGETAARAQYNIGATRAAQQRWAEAAAAYQLCAFTYDSPELCSQALVEAAAALEQLKQIPDAANLLAMVGKDYPNSKAAPLAAERLLKLPSQ